LATLDWPGLRRHPCADTLNMPDDLRQGACHEPVLPCGRLAPWLTGGAAASLDTDWTQNPFVGPSGSLCARPTNHKTPPFTGQNDDAPGVIRTRDLSLRRPAEKWRLSARTACKTGQIWQFAGRWFGRRDHRNLRPHSGDSGRAANSIGPQDSASSSLASASKNSMVGGVDAHHA
jgi:hypothetical protein